MFYFKVFESVFEYSKTFDTKGNRIKLNSSNVHIKRTGILYTSKLATQKDVGDVTICRYVFIVRSAS